MSDAPRQPAWSKLPALARDTGALWEMSGDAARLYLALVLRAYWRDGGRVREAQLQLTEDSGVANINRAMRELVTLGLVDIVSKGNGRTCVATYIVRTAKKGDAPVTLSAADRARLARVKQAAAKWKKGDARVSKGLRRRPKRVTPASTSQECPEFSEAEKPKTVIPAQAQKAEPPTPPAPPEVLKLNERLADLRRWRTRPDRAKALFESLPALLKGTA